MRRFLAMSVVFLSLASCSFSPAWPQLAPRATANPTEVVATLNSRMNKLEQELLYLTADRSCQETSDCRLIRFSFGPCCTGNVFLIYSAKTTDIKALERKVEESDRLCEQLADALSGGCLGPPVLSAPILECRSNVCVGRSSDFSPYPRITPAPIPLLYLPYP